MSFPYSLTGLTGSQAEAWEPRSRGSASIEPREAEPLDLRYQASAWERVKFILKSI